MGIDSDRFPRPVPCRWCGELFKHRTDCPYYARTPLTDRWQLVDEKDFLHRMDLRYRERRSDFGWGKRLSGLRLTRADGTVQFYATNIPYGLHWLEILYKLAHTFPEGIVDWSMLLNNSMEEIGL